MAKKIAKRIAKIIGIIVVVGLALLLVFGLNGCAREVAHVNYNIQKDADNFEIRRRVVALNTRTNEPLFEVEGLISINDDSDGDLNVTIKTDGGYKLFYAHLSDDVTYTSIQLDANDADPYAYNIVFFPARDVIEHGLVNIKTTD